MKVHLNGQMEESILVIGIKENNMEKESILMLKVKKNMENGNTARESDGLKIDLNLFSCEIIQK